MHIIIIDLVCIPQAQNTTPQTGSLTNITTKRPTVYGLILMYIP